MNNFLVTGGAGFIGSHLVDKLVNLGHYVRVWDNCSNGHNQNPLAKNYNISVEKIEPKYHNESSFIFHLAAEARIQPSFKNPMSVHDSNVTGTVRLLELARRTNSNMIFVSSSSVQYGELENPYTFTKWVGENYCRLYHKLFGVKVQIVRPFNVYGPRQPEDPEQSTLIGAFSRQLKSGQPLEITGTGNQRRDFIHVDDLTDGLLALLQDGVNWSEVNIFNLGTGKNYSVNEIAGMFEHPVRYLPARPGEVMDTLADIGYTQSVLAWMPKHELGDYVKNILCAQQKR